jgi:hypothetical protein
VTHEDQRPMAERQELTVRERQNLLRKRADTLPPKPDDRPPRNVTEPYELTAKQRRALVLAANNGIMPGEDGVHKRTHETLKKMGLIQLRSSRKGRTAWRPTDRGRYLIALELPLFLHRRSHLGVGRNGDSRGSGYTNDPRRAMSREPEVLGA